MKINKVQFALKKHELGLMLDLKKSLLLDGRDFSYDDSQRLKEIRQYLDAQVDDIEETNLTDETEPVIDSAHPF